MRVPLRWLREYVDLPDDVPALAHRLTMAGLEVEEIRAVGLPLPGGDVGTKVSGLEWPAESFVVADLVEVREHPGADRLVLADVFDGSATHTVVTGADNVLALRGRGRLEPPVKVALAREGARLYDGHRSGRHLTTLQAAEIRGVESRAMVCSEKELGISDEHEGVIVLDPDAPAAGTPLAEHLGDLVLEIAITPNMVRNACVVGVAREVAALTGAALRLPSFEVEAAGEPVGARVEIEIRDPELNPRFTLLLVEGVASQPSPYWMQHRLRLAGMRPHHLAVDVTNYVMLELGHPLHAFDYDVLVERDRQAAGDERESVPRIITRRAGPEDRLTTLDGVERRVDDFTPLVCDRLGVLSLGGVMGGEESEVSESTTRVLLEAAAWEPIAIRRTVKAQQLQHSEAGYRFSRGVHPDLAPLANRRAAELLRRLSGGRVAPGMVDEYPRPAEPVVVDLPLAEVERLLGIALPADEVRGILESLEFTVEPAGEGVLRATAPGHRLDIGTGIVGRADLVEEIARIYGYHRIPETQIADAMPPQRANPELEAEEAVRDALVRLGLQEVMTYRLTSPEREARVRRYADETGPPEAIGIENPIAADRTILRRTLLPTLLEVVAHNLRFRDTVEVFEIGKVFHGRPYRDGAGELLPDEPLALGIVLTGFGAPEGWAGSGGGEREPMGFFELKGVLAELLDALHVSGVTWESADDAAYHPGRTARVLAGGEPLALAGELHPDVRAAFDLGERPVLVAEVDLPRLLGALSDRPRVEPLPRFPALVEDIAVLVDDAVTSATLEALIRRAGAPLLRDVELFDLYRGEQVGAGRKSLAYRLTFRSDERTLTDEDAATTRQRIVAALESEAGATLRG
ncbi:MAG TPA: phenylalanine--tRNA ligase subunit beta [Thermoanaerobaculia bacterium]|nr:phenylalanine--tRNA ligase subunit beta [Thermoanaerobaculia bacterium]